MSDEHWYEDETGSLVRPYTVTRGRTEPSKRHTIDLMSQVTAVDADVAEAGVDHARAALLALVRRGARPVVDGPTGGRHLPPVGARGQQA
ncbi:DUF742 domain-containing protein, partial [Streptomyces sp. NPDC048279]|uniref:DUF742 domain-containing protein n=1 Tax=Streptomyces sp. NPDC048279 TaxID=3154714 RepID=UPI00344767FB